jgi:L-asparaginase / beta-aspartyl-peptidase
VHRFLQLITLTFLISTLPLAAETTRTPVLVIHGGAGTILRANLTEELEAEIRRALHEALEAGYAILQAGGSSLDAVEAAVKLMEDSPHFNAGRGSVFTAEGRNELDAAIMDGRTGQAGAVAGLTVIRHPISAARAVMQKSPHVFLIGRGADLFATQQGLEVVAPEWFWTERRWKALQQTLMQSAAAEEQRTARLGTVGAVALDRHGNLAAATSTGGMTAKRFGRVGDVPVIGAGTYAENGVVAISATGHGEFFIRNVVAYDIAARMKYGQATLASAADEVINQKLRALKGDGGVIAVDAQGNIAMPFNTAGMYRGSIRAEGEAMVALYGD